MSAVAAGLSLLSSMIAAVFAASVLLQWRRRKKPYQLLWSVGLAMFAVAALLEGISEIAGWSDAAYRIYYALAPTLVGFLGAGSVYLLSRRIGTYFVGYVVSLLFVFIALVGTAQVTQANFAYASPLAFEAGAPCSPGTQITLPEGRLATCGAPVGGNGMPSYVRGLSPLFTIPGSLALIGVAVYSYWKARLAFNLPIAIGAAVVAAGGFLARFGNPSLLYGTELVGIALMYWGFIKASGLPQPAKGAEPAKAG